MCMNLCMLTAQADYNKKLNYNVAFKGPNMIMSNIKLDPAATTIVESNMYM